MPVCLLSPLLTVDIAEAAQYELVRTVVYGKSVDDDRLGGGSTDEGLYGLLQGNGVHRGEL